VLPDRAFADALHIAVATVHEVDYLVTWNCAHIANAEILPRVGEICSSLGFRLPVVCTPDELMGEQPAQLIQSSTSFIASERRRWRRSASIITYSASVSGSVNDDLGGSSNRRRGYLRTRRLQRNASLRFAPVRVAEL
jgi:hypothetical protein